MDNVLAWGFCGSFSRIPEILKKKYTVFLVSDVHNSDLDIYNCFRRILPKSTPDLELRKKLSGSVPVFAELYSRHWYPTKITEKMYLDYFEAYVDYFSSLFRSRKFKAVIFSNIPHEGPDLIVFLVAKLLGVKIYIFFQSIFKGRFFVSGDLQVFDPLLVNRELSENSHLVKVAREAIENVGNWFYMKTVKNSGDFKFWHSLLKNARPHFKKDVVLLLKILYEHCLWLVEYRKNRLKRVSIEQSKYIYFPLHLQPELTTSILGGVFCDQLQAIKDLADSAPLGYQIVVKENPKQSAFKRPPGFYDALNQIPRVRLVSLDHSSISLIKNAAAVATVTGTAGWEAFCIGRPVITFGTCWYREFPGVWSFSSQLNFNSVFEQSFDADKVEQTVDFLIRSTYEGYVDPDYAKIDPSFDCEKNARTVANYIFAMMTTGETIV
jgi:hypothetical protein